MEPTGIGGIDASLAAIQRGDTEGLLRLTRPTPVPCGPLTPDGFALMPECIDGEPYGTAVSVPAAEHLVVFELRRGLSAPQVAFGRELPRESSRLG